MSSSSNYANIRVIRDPDGIAGLLLVRMDKPERKNAIGLQARRGIPQNLQTGSGCFSPSQSWESLCTTKKYDKTFNLLQDYKDLTSIFSSAGRADSGVKILALTGAGDFYSSGTDFTDFASADALDPDKLDQAVEDAAAVLSAFIASFIDFPKVSAIQLWKKGEFERV